MCKDRNTEEAEGMITDKINLIELSDKYFS